MFHFCINFVFDLFSAESSSAERFVTRVAVAGSVVNLNCTLDVNCANKSFRWTHESVFDARSVIWYKNSRLHSEPQSRGVNVEDESAHGRSMLTIPRARLRDSGKFHCYVIGLQHCDMNFQLRVTGNFCQL